MREVILLDLVKFLSPFRPGLALGQAEGGTAPSCVRRQLVCLLRRSLRRSKLLGILLGIPNNTRKYSRPSHRTPSPVFLCCCLACACCCSLACACQLKLKLKLKLLRVASRRKLALAGWLAGEAEMSNMLYSGVNISGYCDSNTE